MTTREFDNLDWEEKIKLICFEAVDLDIREENCHWIKLMQLNNFYIEIYFQHTECAISYIRSFTNTGELNYYLDKIDISELVA
jgi:hypothetical protein